MSDPPASLPPQPQLGPQPPAGSGIPQWAWGLLAVLGTGGAAGLGAFASSSDLDRLEVKFDKLSEAVVELTILVRSNHKNGD